MPAASSSASGSSARPAAVRPTRPLPRCAACLAIASARSGGQPGNSLSISTADARLEREVPVCASCCVPVAPQRPGLLIRQALLLGALERVLLYQDPLALVPPSRAAETHHDRRQGLCFFARRVSAASPDGSNTR